MLLCAARVAGSGWSGLDRGHFWCFCGEVVLLLPLGWPEVADPRMASPNYLTPDGHKQLADELQRLMSVERPKVVREVAEAAAQGDRSENAEYIYGKKRLREIDRRVQFLTRRLDAAVVVRPEELGGDVVRFGAVVEVVDEDGQKKAYTLVGPDESDPAKGKVSFQSPLGQALMKRKVGDVVLVKRPAGDVELEIVSLAYPGR